MKKQLLSIALLFSVITLFAQTFPAQYVSLPNIGNPRIKVVGQNLENYLVYHLDHSNADAKTQSELIAKTNKIVASFRYMDADIFAMCELEQHDSALIYLTNALNTAAGNIVYDYVHDHVSDCNTNGSGYGNIMCSYIYKKATVEPVGDDIAMSSQNTYVPRMRGQFFKEKSSDEVFFLSINHFKAMSGESNVQARLRNAQDLVTKLASPMQTDPDVLVMGDLNCVTTESAIQYLINNGFIEETEKYDSRAYSYYYSGNELIDHALATTSMDAQICGVGVFHVNTGSRNNSYNSTYHYSDHDPVMVGIRLGENSGDEPQPQPCGIDVQYDLTKDLGGFTAYDIAGTAGWSSNSKYGAQLDASRDTEDDWLVSPEIDLSNMTSATVSINHNIYKDYGTQGDYNQYQTMWVTNSFTGNPTTTEWTQVTIPTYGVNSYKTCSIAIPDANLAAGFRFAFHTTSDSPTNNAGNYWEIKSAELKAECEQTAIEDACTEPGEIEAIYTITGQLVGRTFDGLKSGLYIVVRTNKTEKVLIP